MEIFCFHYQQMPNREELFYDSLRLSQAQILRGLYHKRNVDYAYLMWEDFVYQVEHKDHKKSNEMYYPRFTKNTQQFGALLPIEVTNKEIKNYNAYKEYYAVATGAAPPKPKDSIRKTQSSSDTTITPPTTTADKGDDEGKDGEGDDDDNGDDGEEGDDDDDDQEVEKDDEKDDEEEGNGEKDLGVNVGREEGYDEQEKEDKLYRDVNINQGRGHRVIPFDHFINNDLEYLCGGASSCKYTTSVTKTKTVDYRHIKWIEDLVPRTMWIEQPIGYDKHALWGVSHWGRKHQQFYGFTVNRESARDVSIVIQRRVEDLQLGIESYQKKLNLTKPNTYRSNLKRKEAYIAYSNLRGIIYQNKDKKNRLMRIDELHKFSDGTLTDVRTALDDRLKGIRMQYLPQLIWRKSDKDRAAAMIQAIDKRLKTRRIIRSLERFVGGRLYEEDFRMLQRTIWFIVTPTKPGQMTKPYSSYRFIANCFNARNLKMEVKTSATLMPYVLLEVTKW
nr:hypothetical protein [Tanacetum cinerariifolium]